MPQKKTDVLVFINRSSSEFEWILPSLVWLADHNQRVSIVFQRNREFEYLRHSKALSETTMRAGITTYCFEAWVKDAAALNRRLLSLAIRLIQPEVNLKLSGAYQFGLALLTKIVVRRFFETQAIPIEAKVLLVDNSFYKDVELKERGRFAIAFLKLIKTDNVVIFPHLSSPDVERVPATESGIRHSFPQNDVALNSSPDWHRDRAHTRRTLIITDSYIGATQYNRDRGLRIELVGSPKLQKWWIDRTRTPDPERRTQSRILIFSKQRGGQFRVYKNISSSLLLQEVIEVCESKNLDWRLKLHPRDDVHIVEQVLNQSTSKRLEQVILRDSILDSSGQFDATVALPSSASMDAVGRRLPSTYYFRTDPDESRAEFPSMPWVNAGIVSACSNRQQLSDFLDLATISSPERSELISRQYSALIGSYASTRSAADVIESILSGQLSGQDTVRTQTRPKI